MLYPLCSCEIWFDFEPVAVFQLCARSTSGSKISTQFRTGLCVVVLDTLPINSYAIGQGFYLSSSGSAYGKKSEDSKTLYWYSTIADDGGYNQFNSSNYTYYYMAIG